MIRTLMIGSFSACLIAEATATQPSIGIVYNMRENSALIYHCKPLSGDKISCQFTQSAVRLKLSLADRQQRLDQERRNFLEKKVKREETDCKRAQEFNDVLSGKAAPPNGARLDLMTAKTKASLEGMLSASLRFCRDPSLENYISFIRLDLDHQSRTCLVSSYTFSQVLSRSATGAWSVVPEKTGDCGLVQLDRFEAEISSGITFWNYIARKAVTNPSGTFGFGASCSELDQNEYKYSWQKREIDLTCENIEFSPL